MRDDWGPWTQAQQDQNQNANQGTQQGHPPQGHPPQQGGSYPGGYPPGVFPPGYKPPGHGMATAAMVLGILSLVFWLLYIGYIVFAPLAIIFGAVAKKQGSPSGMATAGIVMGIVSVAGGILFWVVCGAFICAIWDDIWYEVMWEMGL